MKAADKKKETTRKPRRAAEGSPARGRAGDKAALVSKVIHNIEEKLEKDQLKATLGDFIRLVQLEKELEEEEQPREIKVTWIEPSEKENASET